MSTINTHSTSTVDSCRLVQLPGMQFDGLSVSMSTGIDVRRVFFITGAPAGASRGSHSHHHDTQVIVAAAGSFSATVDDGHRRRRFDLSSPRVALIIPPGLWTTLADFSSASACLVLTDRLYDEDDYVRDYDTFLRLTSHKITGSNDEA